MPRASSGERQSPPVAEGASGADVTARNLRMQVAILPGGRLHLHDGPIDLVIGADGRADAVRTAFAAAVRRFATVLDELCAELPLLRAELCPNSPRPNGAVAQRMDAAVRPLCGSTFVTRMAAVAGAVADEVLAAMCASAVLTRAYVNNGGDIALHLAPGAVFDVAMAGGLNNDPMLFGTTRIVHDDAVRGIATSGFGGRSFSLGIADAVTILACNAAGADAAATLVANAVDLPDHPAIHRVAARDIDPQSDLCDRLVTRGVGPMSATEIAAALHTGAVEAQHLHEEERLVAAALSLRGQVRTIGALNACSHKPQVFHVV